MKTITEFPAPTLKNAAKTRDELVAAGKTPEELPAALSEALKLEGDRLGQLLNALEAVGSKTNDLKRVIVLGLAEGERAPSGGKLIGEQVFVPEYYPPLNPPAKPGRRGDRDHGDKRGKGRRGGRGKEGGGRPQRGERPQRTQKPDKNGEGK